MTLFRLGLLAAAVSLSSCVVSNVPEPSEFKLSSAALGQKYHASRRTGSVHLYAQSIETTRDQWGRESHQATGGAMFIKDTTPPIKSLQDLSNSPDAKWISVSGNSFQGMVEVRHFVCNSSAH